MITTNINFLWKCSWLSVDESIQFYSPLFLHRESMKWNVFISFISLYHTTLSPSFFEMYLFGQFTTLHVFTIFENWSRKSPKNSKTVQDQEEKHTRNLAWIFSDSELCFDSFWKVATNNGGYRKLRNRAKWNITSWISRIE